VLNVSPATSASVPADSLDALYRRHVPGARRLAFLLTGDRELAEDLAHDAFVRTAARVSFMRDPEAFEGYLKRAVVNASRSHFRHLAVVRRHDHRFEPRDDVIDQPDVGLREQLWDGLQSLPERQRAAVVLRYYGGASERDIATALDCAPGTVKSYLSRAMASLREVIGDE
jgi:RNA polymerase sigma-70 factor (sigma-E family)